MTYFFGLLTKTYIVRYFLFKLCNFAWILVPYFILKICVYKIFEDFFFFRLCCLTHLMDWATSEEAVPLHC